MSPNSVNEFKQYAVYIESVVLLDSIILASLIFLVVGYHAGIETILICLGGILAFPLLFAVCIRGLFYNTVYYDENSIKIVTRKKTSVYTWNEIFRIEPISGGRGGTVGRELVTLTGAKYALYPLSEKFILFVRKNYPHLEVK